MRIATGRKELSQLVLKAMGIFGGVQSLTIICGIIRTKFVALWIGTAGVGLFSIFNQAIELISTVTQLSIRSSAVRDIAAEDEEIPSAKNVIVTIVRRWGWMLGLFGALVMLSTAPLFSRYTFGDYGHTWHFILLSVCVLFSSVTASESAILQGLKRYKALAISSLWGVLGGLTISIPLFYFLRIDSIIPSLIAYSASTVTAMLVYRARKMKPDRPVTVRETFDKGRSFIILGSYLTFSSFVSLLLNYVFTAYLNRRGGGAELGLYQAGYALISRYVGLIFTALAMEYFPRLTSVIQSRQRTSVFVSHETSLIMILLVPIALFFIPAAQILIKILYSEAFLSILTFVVTAMAGMVFRGISWSMAYMILARGDGRTFVWTEVVSSVLGTGLSIVAYEFYGLDGLGWAFTLWYVIYTVIIWAVCRRAGLRVSSGALRAMLFTLSAVLLQIAFYFYGGMWLMITFAIFASIISLILILKLSGSKI